MINKKKIALLNLHYDNNYGGNLQRYALVTTLQRMGYEVTYLYMRFNWSIKGRRFWAKEFVKNAIKRFILFRKNVSICSWKNEDASLVQKYKVTDRFLERYIPHSNVLWGRSWIERYVRHHYFDAFIVGSDQVWRKSYTTRYGIGMWFFDFLPKDYAGKRIAYGASFGVSEPEYTKEEQDKIRSLFNQFNAVSIREKSGLALLNQYGWTSPKATCVLDPTLLLKSDDYINLINAAETSPLDGKLWCYILDMNKEKERLINRKSKELSLSTTIHSISSNAQLSVEQWLRNFHDADYVITDSYHGLIFSLIFHKPFSLIINKGRGATRFESLKQTLAIDFDSSLDWTAFEQQLKAAKQKSLDFLETALSNDNR